MKKKFQLSIIVLLTYTFVCCPVFSGSSFAAGEGNASLIPTAWKERIERVQETAVFIRESIPEWVDDFIVPPTSSEDIKANKETRQAIREEILTKLGINRAR